MANPQSVQRRQFQDVFPNVASGFTVASPGAIANGAIGTVVITVPGVTVAGFWEPIAELTNATNLNVSGVNLYASVTAANTVTITILNNSGGSITPTASSKYLVVMAQVDTKFTS